MLQHILHHHSCTSCSNSDTHTQQATHVLLCTGLEQVSARPAWVATKTGETLCCSIFCIITPVHHAPTVAQCFYVGVTTAVCHAQLQPILYLDGCSCCMQGLTLTHSQQPMCYCAQALNRCQPDLPGLQQKQVRHCVAAYFASSLLYIMLQL